MPKKLMGEILVEAGYLDASDLKKGLEIQKKEGGLIGEILVRMGCLTEEELVSGLSKQLSLPFIRLSRYNVNRTALRLIPREFAEKYLLFPFEQDGQSISIAASNPLDCAEFQELSAHAPSHRLHLFLAPVSEIKQAIETHYSGFSTSGQGSG